MMGNPVFSTDHELSFDSLIDTSFRYHSPCGDLVAKGVYQRMSSQIFEPGATACGLWPRVKILLAEAAAAGIENPVMVGAIPFSKNVRPELFIPLTYRCDKVDRNNGLGEKNFLKEAKAQSQNWDFASAVEEVLTQIADKKIEKAVLSRTLEIKADLKGDGNAILNRLLGHYPDAYCFYLPLGEDHYWVGASPELLLRRSGSSIESFPLAGSIAKGQDLELDRQAKNSLLASMKDRSEHKFVVDEIARLLAPACEQVVVPSGPSLVSAGPLWHLGTAISATLKAPYLSALELAGRLHPTPAVCGYPIQAALQLIDRIEPHARGLYAGMVGWTDAQGNGEWAVTIRCAQYLAGTLCLFAGAGIVAGSLPKAEWQETNIKFTTLLKALCATEGACA